MDNILDKLGLYDFFGLLLPGMFFTGVLVIIDFPLIISFTYPDSEVFNNIGFILVSYICGTIIQEIASYIDEKVIKMRDSAIKEILSDEKLSKSERKKIKKLVKELSKEQDESERCYDAFFKCKEYLEDNGKMKKADKLDAIFAMSRDFIVCNFILFFLVLLTITKYETYTVYYLLLFSLIASIFIFSYRAERYAKMRVRSIFRRYMLCKEGQT